VNAPNSAGCTPVFLASQQGHVHAVRLLLAAGAKPEIPEQAHGMTAVDVADHQVLQLFSAVSPARLPATFSQGGAGSGRHPGIHPGDGGAAAAGRFRPPPPMSCPSVSVFRSGAVGIRWDPPAITYAALLRGVGGGHPPLLDAQQLKKVQQGLALPVTTYTLQVVMCEDDGGRVLPEQALHAATVAKEAATPAPHGLGAGALRQLSGRRAAQQTQQDMDASSGAEGALITSLAMLPGDEGHITVTGSVIATRSVPASAQCKLTLSDTLLLGGVYRVRAAAANALGVGEWSPLTPPLVVAKPPSQCPTPEALLLGRSPPTPAMDECFTPNASLSAAWSQDSHLQVGAVVPVPAEGPLAPLQGEVACLQLQHRDSEPPLDATADSSGNAAPASDLQLDDGPITVTRGCTDVVACVLVHWLGALGMGAAQVCPPSLYHQGACKAAQQSTISEGASTPSANAAAGGFLDGGSEVQAWEIGVWGTPPDPPRPTSVYKRLAVSKHGQGRGGVAPARQLVAKQRLHGELFFCALLGCRVGWAYTVQVSAINRCGPGPTSAPLSLRVPHTLHPLPPAACMPNAGGGAVALEGGSTEAAEEVPPLSEDDFMPVPVEVPIESGYHTPAMQDSQMEVEPRGGVSKPEGPSAGSAFSGRPVADVLAEDFGSTWGAGDTAASDMVLPAGGLASAARGNGSVVAAAAVQLSPTDSDAPRQTAVQPYELQAGAAGSTEGASAHWLDAYSSGAPGNEVGGEKK